MTADHSSPAPYPFGRYLILDRLAMGGMAEIFLALERTDFARRFVILKMIRTDHGEPEYREFFLTEGRVALQCTHANVARVYDVGHVGHVPYISMEFVRGHSLLQLLRQAARTEQLLSVALAITVGTRMAAALDHVHNLTDVAGLPLNVVHRDVSPHNILISHDGTPKLIDFGIVRSSVQTHQTQAGVVKGKFAYIAPEILTHGRVDQRADVFALGVVLHELFTGRPLFRGRSENETVELTKRGLVPPLDAFRTDVPAGIERCIRTALAAEPQRRFHSADALLRALTTAARDAGLYCDAETVRTEVEGLCGPAPAPIYRDSVYYPDAAMVRARRAQGSSNEASASESDGRLAYFLDKAGLSRVHTLTPPRFGSDT